MTIHEARPTFKACLNTGLRLATKAATGSAAYLTSEPMKALTRTYMVHIPYRGAAAALTNLLGGQIQLFFDALTGMIQSGKSGRVRLIDVSSDKPLPDGPTFV